MRSTVSGTCLARVSGHFAPIAEIDSRLKRHYIEVSQQVGRGVRSKASRTTRKINPKQNIHHNQRPERRLGVSPFGSQGNIFVVERLRCIPSVLSGSASAERNASSQAGPTAE